MKQFNWEQDQLAHMKEYIARFGHGSAKLARQAQSKEKTMAKMVAGGLTERVEADRSFSFAFPECEKLPPPVMMFDRVTFGYPGGKLLFKGVDFGVDSDSRIALVGPNGAGKSTLLKLMSGDLDPQEGMVRRHTHMRISRFHQHLQDQLDLKLSALQFFTKVFGEDVPEERMRSTIGMFGLSGKAQLVPMENLSDGQKRRVVFGLMTFRTPNMLLLDEPTNHLDIETIDALADAIKRYQGGVVLVSHDFRLIDQVAQEIWVAEHETITKWSGTIHEYKAALKERVLEEAKHNEWLTASRRGKRR